MDTYQCQPSWRTIRMTQGLGLREVARRAQIDPAHLPPIERGQSRASLEAMARLAKALATWDLARLLAPYLEATK